MNSLPFVDLNLTHNPFGELSSAQRAEVAIVDHHGYVEHLRLPNAAVQFIGPCGRGKSTHLHVLRAFFPDCKYTYCAENERATLPTFAGSLIVVDEVQRMTRRQLDKLFACKLPLALGTHTDYEKKLRRSGRQVISVNVEQIMDRSRLHRILNRRIEFARRDEGRIPSVSLETASNLFAKFGTDVRAIESELYEIFQTMNGPNDV